MVQVDFHVGRGAMARSSDSLVRYRSECSVVFQRPSSVGFDQVQDFEHYTRIDYCRDSDLEIPLRTMRLWPPEEPDMQGVDNPQHLSV